MVSLKKFLYFLEKLLLFFNFKVKGKKYIQTTHKVTFTLSYNIKLFYQTYI